jgi:histone H3/H4
MSSDLLVVMSKVKQHIKKTYGCSMSMEAVGSLNNMVAQILDSSARKTLGERRKIIKAEDIVLRW